MQLVAIGPTLEKNFVNSQTSDWGTWLAPWLPLELSLTADEYKYSAADTPHPYCSAAYWL